MIIQSKPKQLINLEKHQVGWFLIPLIPRRESAEYTLSLFDPSRSSLENSSILSRATHLYKSKLEDFKNLCVALNSNPEFVHVEILHQSSDLGLSYKLLARHKSGKEVHFDGVLYRLSEIVNADGFYLSELEKITGYKGSFDPVILEFENSLREVIPNLNIYSHTGYSFYTATPTNWEAIGIKVEGDPHLRITCKDMNIVTITALIFSEVGKDYFVYLGDRTSTLQMFAHEVFNSMELRTFANLAENKRKTLHIVKRSTSEETASAIAPFYKLVLKHKNWDSIKKSWKMLSEIRNSLTSFDLLIQAYEKVIENKWAYSNGPKQIWLEGEEHDDEEQIAHPCANFFNANLVNSSITEVADEPSEPIYSNRLNELKNLINVITNELSPSINNENTLLTVFQTEFSLYAVWLAVLAFIIAVVSIVMTIIASGAASAAS